MLVDYIVHARRGGGGGREGGKEEEGGRGGGGGEEEEGVTVQRFGAMSVAPSIVSFPPPSCDLGFFSSNHRYFPSHLASGRVIFFSVLALGERDFSIVIRYDTSARTDSRSAMIACHLQNHFEGSKTS